LYFQGEQKTYVIADCRLPISDWFLARIAIGNRQSTIGNQEEVVCYHPWSNRTVILMSEKGIITDRKALELLAPVTTAPIRLHVFVCTGKSCSAVDSAEVKAAFERELLARNMLFGKEKKGKNPKGSVLVTECASVGFCAIGAAVMVYPDGVWYAQVRAADVPELVEEHILNGRVVRRLALLQVPCEGSDDSPAPTAESVNWEA
jgi:(2Fe-2S) ferredoxin